MVLLESFQEQQFLLSGPPALEEGEVQFVEHLILRGVLVQVGETGGAVVSLQRKYFGSLADLALAEVALYLAARAQDVLDCT